MTIGVLPAVVIGGVTYTLVKQEPTAQTAPGPTRYQTSYGSTVGQQINGTATPSPTSSPPQTGSNTLLSRVKNVVSTGKLGPVTNWTYIHDPSIDSELDQKLALAEQYAKEQFENMDDVAKAKAADYMNKELKLDPPLNGSETWEQIASVVGGAAGGAAGTALCGPACGAIGAYCGAYLGVKYEEFLAKNYAEAKAWLESKWGKLKEWADDTWEDIKDEGGDFLDMINPF